MENNDNGSKKSLIIAIELGFMLVLSGLMIAAMMKMAGMPLW